MFPLDVATASSLYKQTFETGAEQVLPTSANRKQRYALAKPITSLLLELKTRLLTKMVFPVFE